MKLMIRKLILTLILCGSSIAFGQQNFSQFVPNAHAIGLGGSAVGLTRDPAASYWNPASLAFITTDRVLINLNDSSQFNYIGMTKFFPPSIALGINVCKSGVPDRWHDWAIIALGYRINPLFSIGTNVNLGKTEDNEIMSSFGVGIFFKSFPIYRTTRSTKFSFSEWFTSKRMQDKFNFGLAVHNIPINNNQPNYEIRVAAAIKPISPGPLFHFAYHASQDSFSLHPGLQIPLFKNTEIFVGATDFKPDQFALGGTTQWGPFQVDLGYSSIDAKIHVSLLIRLSDERKILLQKYKNFGSEKVKEEDLEGALTNYTKALAYEPENDELNYLVSVLNREVNEKSLAIDSLFSSGESYEAKGWYINAFNSYQRILELDRNNSSAQKCIKNLNPKLSRYLDQLFRQGVVSYHQKDILRSQKIFEQILSVDKNHPGAKVYLAKVDSMNSTVANDYFYRGLGYYRQKNLVRARQEFKDALYLNPNNKQAQEYLQTVDREIESNRRQIERLLTEAKTYEQRGLYIKANTDYRKILEIDPNHDLARRKLELLKGYLKTAVEDKFQRARNLYNRNDYSGAILALKEILLIDPGHASSKNYLKRATQKIEALAEQHYQRAQNFFQQKNWDNAIQECNLTLSMNPNHPTAEQLHRMALANISLDKLQSRGLQYFEQGDYANARAIFSQIIAKEPYNAPAKDYLKRSEKALEDRITELFNSGMIKYAEGDYEEAINEWNKALKIDPRHASALEYIQKAREKLEALSRIE